MLMIHESRLFGDETSRHVFLQLVDEHDMALMESEAEAFRSFSGGSDWCIQAIPVSDWNQDLTPWEADPVFGKQRFGNGAPQTLQGLLAFIKDAGRRYYLCGYSLAGLFALWASYQTPAFSGVVAASPSVWYPDWISYSDKHSIQTPLVYLSLGDKEEKARNPIMASVGNAIRRQHEILISSGVEAVLEWNPGNHFVNSDQRTAKGIAWMLEKINGGNGR